jgi:hypothetical protein
MSLAHLSTYPALVRLEPCRALEKFHPAGGAKRMVPARQRACGYGVGIRMAHNRRRCRDTGYVGALLQWAQWLVPTMTVVALIGPVAGVLCAFEIMSAGSSGDGFQVLLHGCQAGPPLSREIPCWPVVWQPKRLSRFFTSSLTRLCFQQPSKASCACQRLSRSLIGLP